MTNYMDDYFVGIKSIYTHHWNYTFPEFKPVKDPSGFQDIQLADGLYNVNTIESVASAMEVPVINARNIAMMIADGVHKEDQYEEYMNDC